LYIYDVSGVIGMKCGVLVSGGETQAEQVLVGLISQLHMN
jgi:hypothetical protein